MKIHVTDNCIYLNFKFSKTKYQHWQLCVLLENSNMVAGSQHDPASDECAPFSFNDGKYIMYTYSVSGYEPNNMVSPSKKKSAGRSSCNTNLFYNFIPVRQLRIYQNLLFISFKIL